MSTDVAHNRAVLPARVELEPHQLQRPLAALRVPDAGALRALERSLAQAGQLNPCIVVRVAGEGAVSGAGYVLIDGYRRVAALHRLERDTVWVECWQCSFAEALARLLARTASRAWAPLEEALMLRELANTAKLSQHALARCIGRDVSWVSRRLALLDALSDELLGAVCAGQISVWAATRVLAPLARANTAHAQALLRALREQPMSTRQLCRWYRHYADAPRNLRERLVEQPHLFTKASEHADQARGDKRLREGPEGEWTRALGAIAGQLTRLRKSLPTLANDEAFVAELRPALERLRNAFDHLERDFDHHARHRLTRTARECAHAEHTGRAAAPDKPSAQAFAQYRASHPQGALGDEQHR